VTDQPHAAPDILVRRRADFVLWCPGVTDPVPRLVIGRFAAGNPATLVGRTVIDLRPVPGFGDLWAVPAADCGLTYGQVCHYWFEVADSCPFGHSGRIERTDPFATTVDWRLLSLPLDAPYTDADRWPASVVQWRGAELVECGPDGGEPEAAADGDVPLPANNRTVYYKLPTTWARRSAEGGTELAVGTFPDVLALIDPDAAPLNLRGVRALAPGRSNLRELGITTLELTPAADTWVARMWGYSTSNYLAPDQDLGFPDGYSASSPGPSAPATSTWSPAGPRPHRAPPGGR